MSGWATGERKKHLVRGVGESGISPAVNILRLDIGSRAAAAPRRGCEPEHLRATANAVRFRRKIAKKQTAHLAMYVKLKNYSGISRVARIYPHPTPDKRACRSSGGVCEPESKTRGVLGGENGNFAQSANIPTPYAW